MVNRGLASIVEFQIRFSMKFLDLFAFVEMVMISKMRWFACLKESKRRL